MRQNNDAEILYVYERWHQTIVGRDLDTPRMRSLKRP
jgi:hypothetical protein